MKKCPKCSKELSPKSIGPVEVDECKACHGIWFDKDELNQAEEATDTDLQWLSFAIWKDKNQFSSGKAASKCPACKDSTLVQLNYGDTGVKIDFCPGCKGTWLDEGEFEKIIEALEKELLSQPLSEYVRESLDEAKKIVTHPESLVTEWKDLSQLMRLMQYRLFVENPDLLRTISTVQSSTPFT